MQLQGDHISRLRHTMPAQAPEGERDDYTINASITVALAKAAYGTCGSSSNAGNAPTKQGSLSQKAAEAASSLARSSKAQTRRTSLVIDGASAARSVTLRRNSVCGSLGGDFSSVMAQNAAYFAMLRVDVCLSDQHLVRRDAVSRKTELTSTIMLRSSYHTISSYLLEWHIHFPRKS
jgi:hypothetical protein